MAQGKTIAEWMAERGVSLAALVEASALDRRGEAAVEESFSRPRNASATAPRYGISGALLFAWHKAYREGRLGGEPLNGLVPAVLVPEAQGAGDAISYAA